MTATFPLGDARATTGNGRRAGTARSLTAVAHLSITHVRVTHSVTQRNKQGVKKSSEEHTCFKTGEYQRGISEIKTHINGDAP